MDPDPVKGVRNASEFFFTLVHNTSKHKSGPVLIRGALSYGKVGHYIPSANARDLTPVTPVGPAVVEAVNLERQPGMKGPRLLLLTESLTNVIRQRDSSLAAWLLRPTSASEIWEALWLLPPNPEHVDDMNARLIKSLCDLALGLVQRHGSSPQHGKHYQQFLLLAARARERANQWKLEGTPKPFDWIDPLLVKKMLDQTSGLSNEYEGTLLRVLRI